MDKVDQLTHERDEYEGVVHDAMLDVLRRVETLIDQMPRGGTMYVSQRDHDDTRREIEAAQKALQRYDELDVAVWNALGEALGRTEGVTVG